ncbi:hypothetical protein LCGC14_2915760 [marine sediment metagenome]|uniref:Uncharacterized protein n=1 Tax=marine sediment metagenome TaxID=412755 RepID=A0A0F8XQJ2_9ZZZZ
MGKIEELNIDPQVITVFKIIIKHKFAMFGELKEYGKKNNIPLKELNRLIMLARL